MGSIAIHFDRYISIAISIGLAAHKPCRVMGIAKIIFSKCFEKKYCTAIHLHNQSEIKVISFEQQIDPLSLWYFLFVIFISYPLCSMLKVSFVFHVHIPCVQCCKYPFCPCHKHGLSVPRRIWGGRWRIRIFLPQVLAVAMAHVASSRLLRRRVRRTPFCGP